MNRFLRVCALALVAGVALASTAQAQTAQWLYWNQTSEDWVDVTANWTCTYPSGNPSAVPGDGDMAIIKTAGTVKVDATHVFAGSPAQIWVGDGAGIDTSTEPYSPYDPGAGSLLQVGGTVNFGNQLYVGHGGAPGTSTYEIQGGSLIQTGTGKTVIGYSGATGEMTVSGTVLDPAIIELHGDLQIGLDSSTSVGKLSMSGESSLTIDSGQFQLGSVGGTGTLEMSGNASINATSAYAVLIGLLSSANATLNMSGDSSFEATGTLVAYDIVESCTITLDDNATYTDYGTFHAGYCGTPGYPRTDIDITVAGNATLETVNMYMGLYKGSDATVLVSSDSATLTDTAKLNVNGFLCIGYLGGYGDLTVGDRGVVTHASIENIYVGHGLHDGIVGSGAVTIESGGTFDNTSSTGIVNIGGDGSVGSWTQNGGSMLNAQGVYLGYNAGTATLNLNGGVFEAAFVRTGASAPASATVNFNGGTLRAVADSSNFVGDDGATPVLVANVQASGAVIDTNGFNVTIDAALVEDAGSPNGGLMKLGLGVLSLGGTSTFTGDTTVVGGALDLDGALAGDVCVNAGAAIMGNGSIGGKLDVATGGSIAPGGSIGTLAVSGNVTLCGTLDVEYNSDDGTTDRLDVDGILTIAGGTLSFTDLGSSGYTGPYVIASYDMLVGEPAIELGLPVGWSVDYSYNGKQIALVPEPGMAVFLITALLGLAWRRKWRQTKHTP